MSDESGPLASFGGASARGIGLIVVAVVAGFILIGSGFDTDGGGSSGPAALPAGAEPSPDSSTSSTTSTTLAPALAPEEVRVLVVNASSTNGAAGKFTDRLNALNYPTLSPGDFDPNREDTVVYFREGFQQEAAVIAETIGAAESAVQPVPDPSPVSTPDGQTAPDVTVLVGGDIAGG